MKRSITSLIVAGAILLGGAAAPAAASPVGISQPAAVAGLSGARTYWDDVQWFYNRKGVGGWAWRATSGWGFVVNQINYWG